MEAESLGRLRGMLGGAVVDPVVAGLTFVDPALLPGCAGASPETALARTCAGLGLDFAFVPSSRPWAAAALRELRVVGVASIWAVPGVMWPALDSVGPAVGLRLVAVDPRELEPALDAAAAAAREALLEGLGLGADGFAIADDMAGAEGPIVAPDFLRAAVFPRLAGLVALAARDGSVPVMLHCDGAAEALYGDIRAMGFTGVHGDCGGAESIQAALAAARSAGLCLVGGLSAVGLTAPDHGMAAGRRAMALARLGGLAVADDGGVSTPAEAVALIAALSARRRA